jgi:hypothetical protein
LTIVQQVQCVAIPDLHRNEEKKRSGRKEERKEGRKEEREVGR